MDNIEKFEWLLNSTKLDGIENLIAYIKTETDFYRAPASTKYHSSHEGGLLQHSLNVFDSIKTMPLGKRSVTTNSLIVIALLHDICKSNYYKNDFRNVKNTSGVWERVPYYSVEDNFPYGHGEKSVFIISKFIKLTDEEAFAIRYHMGGFEKDNANVSCAFGKYPLSVLLHMADLYACYIMENADAK